MNRGQRIAYDVFGHGPAVVLQHSLLSSRQSWKDLGYVARLADAFTVITVDSLGHGDSDKPAEAACYERAARVGDVVAILDAEKTNKAHYVGYSMGAWSGMGLLAHRPERLLSLTIGGWDPAPNDQTSMLAQMPIDQFLDRARPIVPALVDAVTPDMKPGLAGCLNALGVAEIPVDILINCNLPVHLWAGVEDSCYESLKTLHGKMPESTFSAVPGDHFGAIVTANRASADAIHAFLTNIP